MDTIIFTDLVCRRGPGKVSYVNKVWVISKSPIKIQLHHGQVGLSMGIHCPIWGPPYRIVHSITLYHGTGGTVISNHWTGLRTGLLDWHLNWICLNHLISSQSEEWRSHMILLWPIIHCTCKHSTFSTCKIQTHAKKSLVKFSVIFEVAAIV